MGLPHLLLLENVIANAIVIINITVFVLVLFGINSDMKIKILIQMEAVK